MSWKSYINSALGRIGYRITKVVSEQISENVQFEEAGRDPVLSFSEAANALESQWSAGSGHDIIKALSPLAGRPIPYAMDQYPHAFFFSTHNTYAPWHRDTALQRWAAIVRPPRLHMPGTGKPHTLVDIYRCWTIWQTVSQLAELEGDFIEIGAYRGGTSALIAHAISTTMQAGDLFICDTFHGVVKAGDNDTAYRGGEHADTSVEQVSGLVGQFIDPRRFFIQVGIFPEDSGDAVQGRLFKFAHIDVDVYQGAIDCVHFLWPNLVPNGVIIFDDYGLQGTEGMTRAAEELASLYADAMLIYNFNGQAMLTKMATV